MFNNHDMSIVTDLRLIGNDIMNVDLLTVAAITTSEYPSYPNIYCASILVPPTELLMRWAEGDPLILQNVYPRYLAESKECDDMIVALIAALTRKNIILYIPQDEFNIFGTMLLNHIYYMYGITVNSPASNFSVNQSKIPFIMAKFYMMNIMEPDVFLDAYPANYMLPDFVINKLAMDLHPFNQPATFEQYKNYFNQLNASKVIRQEPIMITRSITEVNNQ